MQDNRLLRALQFNIGGRNNVDTETARVVGVVGVGVAFVGVVFKAGIHRCEQTFKVRVDDKRHTELLLNGGELQRGLVLLRHLRVTSVISWQPNWMCSSSLSSVANPWKQWRQKCFLLCLWSDG
jgi:hypothetical protein